MGDIRLTAACGRATVVFTVCLVISFWCALASASGLSPSDKTQLTQDFVTLASGYDQTANDSARAIMLNNAYTASDLEAFFETYFNVEGHAYVDPLAENIHNNAFYWGDPQPYHLKLQQSLINPLWNMVTALVASHIANLGQTMYDDVGLRQSLFNGHKFFAILAKEGVVDSSARNTIYARYITYISAYPQYFTDIWLNPVLQPFVPELRGQVWISFAETLPLNDTRRTEIANTIALAGPNNKKYTLWNTKSLMVIDNTGYSEAHLDVMLRVLNAIPSELIDPAQPGNLRYVYNRSAFQTTPNNESVFGRGSAASLNYRFLKYGGSIGFETLTQNGLEGVSGGSIPSDQWSHVAAVVSGSSVSMYINGSLVSSGSIAGTPIASGQQDLYLGSDPRFFDQFKGKLDQVKIYQRGLSAGEVSNLYLGNAVSNTNLVADYELNESSGTLVSDASGSGNNGSRDQAAIVQGKTGNGLWFDGVNDKVTVPSSPSLAGNGSFTLAAWIYWVSETVYPNPGNADAVNLYATPVGSAPSNEFPSDIAPATMDGFASFITHEFNHTVDHFSVQGVPANNTRLHALITQAGTTVSQYLRSQILDATSPSFFVDNPQELFASISQEYFCDSDHTLKLALQRFDAGYHEPLNQFLFFTNIYSLSGNSTLFYWTDNNASVIRYKIPLRHFPGGGVKLLAFNGHCYKFTLDGNGNAIAYADFPDSDSDGLTNAEEATLGTNPNAADSDGDGLSDLDEVWYDNNESYNPYNAQTNPGGTDLNANSFDTDGDGLSDAWEIQYSLNPIDSIGDNGGAGDPDGDGYSNLEEMQGGSDPHDSDSVPTPVPVSSALALAITGLLILGCARSALRRNAA